MLVDIDDVIINDVEIVLDELLDIYWMRIVEMETVLKNWCDKIKNYGVKNDNALYSKPRKLTKKIVRVYPRVLLKNGYSISKLDGLRKYSSNMTQFGGMICEELKKSTVTYIISILRCNDEKLLENISEIKNNCPCKNLFLVWNDIQAYLDLRIKVIKLEKLRNGLTIEDDSKDKGYQKVLNKQKPET